MAIRLSFAVGKKKQTKTMVAVWPEKKRSFVMAIFSP